MSVGVISPAETYNLWPTGINSSTDIKIHLFCLNPVVLLQFLDIFLLCNEINIIVQRGIRQVSVCTFAFDLG